MNRNSFIIITACLALTTLAFQNCTKANFSSDEIAQVAGGDDGKVPSGGDVPPLDGSIPTETEVEQNCANRTLTTKNYTINFPKPNLCEWNMNGNLQTRNGWVQARQEQSVTLDVPANAVICDLKFTFPTQATKYDDQIILTLNNYVIATSQKELVNAFPKDGDLSRYDWESIKGKQIDPGGFNAYISGQELGLATLNMPPTQTSGQISLQMQKELFYKFAAVKASGQQHKFGFITTGDDDTGVDCQHDAIGFSVKASYYTP